MDSISRFASFIRDRPAGLSTIFVALLARAIRGRRPGHRQDRTIQGSGEMCQGVDPKAPTVPLKRSKSAFGLTFSIACMVAGGWCRSQYPSPTLFPLSGANGCYVGDCFLHQSSACATSGEMQLILEQRVRQQPTHDVCLGQFFRISMNGDLRFLE